MTTFIYERYIYTFYWNTGKYTKKAARKNGVEREIGESLYRCMEAAFNRYGPNGNKYRK